MNSLGEILLCNIPLNHRGMNQGFRDALWRIRKTIPISFDHFYEQIMDLIIGNMGSRADELCAPYSKRVGIFGPYSGDGKKLILEIARKVSACGCGAMTGLGYFAMNQPEELHSLSELMPSAAHAAIKTFEVPDYIWFRHFPKLVCKAVHHLSVVRGQRNEAEGCFSEGIPMMGFILDQRVQRKGKYCPYLQMFAMHSECMCPDHELCFHPKLKASCPFYDYVNIPWLVKQLFINETNRLVAVKTLENMSYVVEECIKAKPFKRKIQYDL